MSDKQSAKIEFRKIEHGSEEYLREVILRDEILRRPHGLNIYDEDLSSENLYTHVGAFMNDVLVGTLYIKPISKMTRQIKQVAVKEAYRGHNIGRGMVEFAEQIARKSGALKLVLDSRATACGFYEKLGFSNIGLEIKYFDIPHLKMEKAIAAV